MSFAAQYAGQCMARQCQYADPGRDGFIKPGDEVAYVGKEIMHDACASVEARRNKSERYCTGCGTAHAGSRCDE